MINKVMFLSCVAICLLEITSLAIFFFTLLFVTWPCVTLVRMNERMLAYDQIFGYVDIR